MTAETFITRTKTALSSVSGVVWNSVTQSRLRALGRSFERGELTPQEAISELRGIFPLSSIRGPVEEALIKTLR